MKEEVRSLKESRLETGKWSLNLIEEVKMKQAKLEHLWDKLFKIIGDYYPNDLVKFLFPDREIKLCGKYEQEKVVIEYQIADINFWILDDGVEKLLNIEPYSSWTSSIPAVVFTRNGILTKALDYKYEVISVALVLEKRAYSGTYKVGFGKKVVNQYRFPVVSFQDIEGILKQYRFLAPFVIKVDRTYQSRVIDIVKDDNLLKALTVLVLSRLLNLTQKEVLEIMGSKLEEFKQALLEVPIMQDLAQDWKDEERKMIAKNMLRKGLEIDLIAEITGLSIEEIGELNRN